MASHIAQLSNHSRDCCVRVHCGSTLLSPGMTRLPSFSGNDPANVHSLSGCTPPLHVCHFIFIPPATSKHQVHPGAAQTSLFGTEESLTCLSSQNPAADPGGHQTWGCSRPGPCTGPRDIIVPKHSPYCLIFQFPLQFWPPTFIYAGIPLAVHSVPQKIG